MARLYDWIIDRGFEICGVPNDNKTGSFYEKVRNDLEKAVIVNIDNVTRYFFIESDQEYWTCDDFPNIAPPWPRAFYEYKNPAYMRNEKGIIKWEDPFMSQCKTGTLICSWNPFDADSEIVKRIGFPPIDIGIRWISHYLTFIGHKHMKRIISGHFCTAMIDKNGIILKVSGDIWRAFGAMAGMKYIHPDYQVEKEERLVFHGMTENPSPMDAVKGLSAWEHVCMLTNSFLHCRNVQLIENRMSKAKQKLRIRAGLKPFKRHYTLEIEPIKRVLKNEGKSEETGTKRALHICRGHFRDYQERGLFGKYKGIFWFDMHVRGSRDIGEIKKDYRIAT